MAHNDNLQLATGVAVLRRHRHNMLISSVRTTNVLTRCLHIFTDTSCKRTLLKMWCDDPTNHRSLQRCDQSQRLLGATVTLNRRFYSYAIMHGHYNSVVRMRIPGNESAILYNGT